MTGDERSRRRQCLCIIHANTGWTMDAGQAIDLIDQPRLFASSLEWNSNLFKRVADCIRDGLAANSDTLSQRRLKNWAVPYCNQVLQRLNSNWPANNATGNSRSSSYVQTLIGQEFCWNQIAYGMYGLHTLSQACGLNDTIVECSFVNP